MLWPIANPPASLPPGYRFGAPRPYRNGVHQGVDLGRRGDAVYAADAGVVSFAGQSKGLGGIMIYIKHGALETRYMHLATGSLRVKRGQRVAAGQRIATVGATGITTAAPHLHFEVLRNGVKVDPEGVLRGGGGGVVMLAAAAVVFYLAVLA